MKLKWAYKMTDRQIIDEIKANEHQIKVCEINIRILKRTMEIRKEEKCRSVTK